MIATQSQEFEKVAEFIASLSPEKVLAYKASASLQKRVVFLVKLKTEGKISDAEVLELDSYFLLEHIFRMAKIRAFKKLKSKNESLRPYAFEKIGV